MAKVDVKNLQGNVVGSVELEDSVFGEEVHEHLLWETVKWQRAKARSGTHSVKRRDEVAGSKLKPWKQKGTGRARQGSKRSPVWVGGGSTFGPKPRDYEYNMPKKAKKKALRSALSLRTQENQIIVVDNFSVDGKTKSVASALAKLGCKQPSAKVLIIDSAENGKLALGTRNMAYSKWLAPEGLNVYDILNHQTVIFAKGVLAQVQDALRATAKE